MVQIPHTYTNSSKRHDWFNWCLQPGVPGRVHPAEVVCAAGRRHQLAHLALRPVEGAEAGESRRDGRHRLAHCADDRLPVLLLNLQIDYQGSVSCVLLNMFSPKLEYHQRLWTVEEEEDCQKSFCARQSSHLSALLSILPGS